MPNQRIISTIEAYRLFLADRKSQGLEAGTLRFYKDKVGLFARWCEANGYTSVADITPAIVRAYFAHLRDKGNSQGTQNAAGRGIRAFLRWCEAEEITEAHPLRNVKIPRPPKEVLPAFTPADVQKLLAVAPDERSRALVLFLLDTGIRVGELCRLNGEDIDIAAGTVLIRRGKTGKTRTVFLSAASRKALLAYWKVAGWPEGYTPVWRNERNGKRLTDSGIRQPLQEMGREAGVKGAKPHQFRRTFAITALRAGVDLHTLARMMGHSGLQVLKQYLDISDADTRAAHERASVVDTFLK